MKRPSDTDARPPAGRVRRAPRPATAVRPAPDAPFGRPLPRAFYARGVVSVARALLGRVLIHATDAGVTAGRIVEVEAYRGPGDPASHAWRGKTPRTAIMFGAPGHAYVYFTYGMHHCFNVVAEGVGIPAAVLVRACEPIAGLELMERRRGPVPRERLLRGPGCVARALGIDLTHDGLDLTRPPLWISDRDPVRHGRRIARSARIGIRRATEREWRFFLAGDPCVSGTQRARNIAFVVDTPGGRS